MTRAQNTPASGSSVETWWQLPVFHKLSLRLAVLALLIAVYLKVDWIYLRKALRSCIAWLLSSAGHRTTSVGQSTDLLLAVDKKVYAVSANCTYLDLVLTLAPFYWRRAQRAPANLRRLSVLALAILLGSDTYAILRRVVVIACFLIMGSHIQYTASQRDETMAALWEARAEESKLQAMALSLITELDLKTLLSKILDTSRDLLSADRGTLFMYEPKSDRLVSRIAHGMGETPIVIPSHVGIAGAAFQSGEVLQGWRH